MPFIFLEAMCLGILSATDKSSNKKFKKKEKKKTKLISQNNKALLNKG